MPIPGTTSVAHLHEDLAAADVKLVAADHGPRPKALINQQTVSGPRYNAQSASEVSIARKSLTLVCVGPVTQRSPIASK